LQRTVYQNEFPHPQHGLLDVLRWKLGWGAREAKRSLPEPFPAGALSPVSPDLNRLRTPEPAQIQLTWIGHSTFLIQHGGRNMLTDPIFGDCLTPFPGVRLRRGAPPGLMPEQLPPIHHVLISHCHYDHLDLPTVRRLNGPQHAARFWLPSNLGGWFRRKRVFRFQELAWWQSAKMEADMEVVSVPAQHFAARGPFDRNRTHWCGWLVRHAGRTIYFAGDTGYSPGFRQIGERFGGVDLALIPIGAYRPRWLMKPMHADPFEAVKIHQDVHSRFSVAGHWGTFRLTDEPPAEPPALLQVALAEQKLSPRDFVWLRPGETISL
jgi:N-acyl-phosphatidylethanolamine-hydrolysing phospholipase D